MSTNEEFRGLTVAVVGAGRSGVAAAELLAHLGAHPILTDRRAADQLPYLSRLADERVELALGGHPDDLWDRVEAAILSPGIPEDSPPMRAARERGIRVLSEVELAGRYATAPAVAITGSNGKSTVTTMVGAILERAGMRPAVCGNIGTPFARCVLEALRGERDPGCYVLELSSFQTETIVDFHPRYAAILNLSADHLDRHGSLAAYGNAKLRLVRNCTAADWVVYGADDPWVSAHLPRDAAVPVPFATSPPANGGPRAWVADGAVFWRAPDGDTVRVVELSETSLVGTHNALNAAAAIAVSCLAGASCEQAADAVRAFRGLAHRMQTCGEPRGIRCIDDSKATNVGATLASLSGLDRPVWLILGGRDKDSDFNRLRSRLPGRVRSVLLIGEAAGRIAASLHGAAPLRHCGTIDRAIDAALSQGAPGDVLLLAPACTSFDQFDDFEHRGRTFQSLVAERAAL